MSPTERKVTSLAVASQVVPFAFLTVLVLVVGDTSSPGNIALLVSALVLVVAGQSGSGPLQRRLWPGHARLHRRVEGRTFSVCIIVFSLVFTAEAAIDADWLNVLFYGLIAICLLFLLLRETRAEASRSPEFT